MVFKRIKFFSFFAFSAVCGLFLLSCSNGGSTDKKNAVDTVQAFPFPEIPSLITDVEHRMNYLLQNYWNNFDFTDSVMQKQADVAEQGLVDFLSLLSSDDVSDWLIEESIDNFCVKMEAYPLSRKLFMENIDRYLYNPDSPCYNESLYTVYLNRMLESRFIDEDSKLSLKFRLSLIQRNNPGDTATDFTYFLPDGSKRTLMQTDTGEGRLLIIFYDPFCTSCQQIMSHLIENNSLREWVRDKKLTVLAVYTEDSLEDWRSSISHMPADWIVAHDNMVIKDKALYDLKAMPSLYLLDRNKKVILKDASASAVLKALY